MFFGSQTAQKIRRLTKPITRKIEPGIPVQQHNYIGRASKKIILLLMTPKMNN